jgi:uncharacterized protein YegL
MIDRIDPNTIHTPATADAALACALLLDSSYSMKGKPIDDVNAGLKALRADLLADPITQRRVDIAVITFGGDVQLIQDFTPVRDWPEPPALQASGSTPMGEAFSLATSMIRRQKEFYRAEGRSQYRPWIFCLTDGLPTDDVQSVLPLVHAGVDSRSWNLFVVGCGDVDMDDLQAIAHPSTPALRLREGMFPELFLWLRDSLESVAKSNPGEQAPAAPVDGWASLQA